MKETIQDLLIRQKPSKLIIEIYNNNNKPLLYCSNKVDLTYSHACIIMSTLVKLKYVIKKKIGRNLNYIFTSKGKKLYSVLSELYNLE